MSYTLSFKLGARRPGHHTKTRVHIKIKIRRTLRPWLGFKTYRTDYTMHVGRSLYLNYHGGNFSNMLSGFMCSVEALASDLDLLNQQGWTFYWLDRWGRITDTEWVAREQFHVEFDEFDFLRGRLPRIFWRPDRDAPLRSS